MSNILFISPNPIWGGAATANIAIAKMLQDNGHHVIVNDEYLSLQEYNGLKIDHTPTHQKKFSDRGLLMKLIDDNKIDCVIWSPLVAIYFYQDIKRLKRLGVKQIAIVHSLSLTKDIKGKLMDFLVSLTLSRMSTIVYVSQYTKESWDKFRAIRKSNAKKIVIHNVIEANTISHSFDLDNPRIGFVGRLSVEKQPYVFCELSSELNYNFCVYGEGPLLDELKNQYKNIDFKGLCNDINEIYSNIDILVMTSQFENCPMVILEAQSRGIPCVAPNVGGIPELIESGFNGILFDGYDAKTIANCIKDVINDYARYAQNCYDSSLNHTPKSVISTWNKLFN